MKTPQLLTALAIIILVVIGGWWLLERPVAPQGEHLIEATFVAPSGASINVVFDNNTETATLSGAGYANVVFAQAISASGARYENEELGLVLWNKGNDITLYQNDEPIFTGTVPASAGESASLTGATWAWTETIMNDDTVIAPRQAGAFTLTFENGRVSGTTDCNGFSGSYGISAGNTLSFGPFMQTLMYCEGSQEAEFVRMVSDSSHFMFTAEGNLVLLLKFDSGSVMFERQ